jgi:hypothetical protein
MSVAPVYSSSSQPADCAQPFHGSREKYLQAIFKEKIGVQDESLFQMIWHQALKLHQIRLVKSDAISDQIQRIDEAIRDTLLFHGPGIDFSSGSHAQISEMVRYLLGKGVFSTEWLDRANARGVLIRKDPELLKGARDAFREVLLSCSEHLPIAGTKEEIVFQAFIGNIVALLPFFYPEEGEEFTIPQKVDGQWKNFQYIVDRKLDLTPRWFSTPISAFGLTSKEGPPLLTFLGTTYPAADGYVATLLADFTPGLSVGHAPYLFGKKEIARWLEDKQGVRLFGASLGGALTLHVMRNHREKIASVDAYNPPGLYPWDWRGGKDYPETNIYYQDNDLVGTLGFFPEGDKVHLYRVLGEKQENFIKAHARAYTGSEEVTILKSSPAYENSRFVRKLFTALHILFGMVLVFLPILFFYLLYSLFAQIAHLLH